MLSALRPWRPVRLIHRALGVLLLVGAFVFASGDPASAAPSTSPGAPSAAAPNGATFGIGPANIKKIDGRPLLSYLSSPGGQLTDHVALENFASRPVALRVYVVDAVNSADGAIGYQPRSAKRVGAASWLAVSIPHLASTVTIAPRSSRILTVSLTVPLNATPGDHAAGIIASLTSKVTSTNGQLVDFEQRVALRTFIRVSGALSPQLSIDNLRASFRGGVTGRGDAAISYSVRNTGNVKLGGRQRITIRGLAGATGSVPALADIPILLPGGIITVSVTVPKVLEQSRMTAAVTISPLQPQGDVDPPAGQARATVTFWAIPWSVLGALAAVLTSGGLWWWLRRHRRKPASPLTSAPKHSANAVEEAAV
jgi:hypothetical protein